MPGNFKRTVPIGGFQVQVSAAAASSDRVEVTVTGTSGKDRGDLVKLLQTTLATNWSASQKKNPPPHAVIISFFPSAGIWNRAEEPERNAAAIVKTLQLLAEEIPTLEGLRAEIIRREAQREGEVTTARHRLAMQATETLRTGIVRILQNHAVTVTPELRDALDGFIIEEEMGKPPRRML